MNREDDDKDGEDSPFNPDAFRARAPASISEAFGPRGLPVRASDDLARVLRLPRRPQVTEGSPTAEAMIQVCMRRYSRHLLDENARPIGNPGELIEAATGRPRKCACKEIDPARPRCITTLLWLQSWALYEIEQVGGLIASLAVGSGKTMLDILSPLAFNVPLSLLLIPPTLLEQFVLDYQIAAEHFYVPSVVVHVSAKRPWRSLAQTLHDGSPAPMLHVLPYSQLSSITSSSWIERLRPDAIISDECDSISSLESARTLRLVRYMRDHWQATKFACWSGSLISSKLAQAGHLSAFALRENSPLPLDPQVTEEWGRCVDPVKNPVPAGALVNLLDPGESATLENVRGALRRRIAETPGFVIVGGHQIIKRSSGEEVDLRIVERPAPKLPDIIERALASVRQAIRPDTLGGAEQDEILADPMEQARCACEIASGVFNKWAFHPINGVPQRRDLILEWYARRKDFNSELREQMLRGEENLDSIGLCERAAMRAWGYAASDPSLPLWKPKSFPGWYGIKDRVVPTPEAVRLDSYLVDDAIAWAREYTGIVWYSSVPWGLWMRERSGMPLFEGGKKSGALLRKEDGSRSIIVSLKSRGRGWNGLQFVFSKQLYGQIMSSAAILEQGLGRLHRPGQEAEAVETLLYLHTDELRRNYENAINKAQFVDGITSAKHKVLAYGG